MFNDKVRRFTAYCLDLLIITLIATGLFEIKALHPNADKYEKAYTEYQDYVTKVNNAGKKEEKSQKTIITYISNELSEDEVDTLIKDIEKIKNVSKVKLITKDDIDEKENNTLLKDLKEYFKDNDNKAIIVTTDKLETTKDIVKEIESIELVLEVKNYDEKNDDEQVKAIADMSDKEKDDYLEKTGSMLRDVDYYGISYNVCWLVVVILYFTLFPYFNNGMTIGKRVVKLKVVRSDDETKKVGLWQYLIKAILCPIYGTGMLSNTLTFIVMIVTPLFLDGATFAYTTTYVNLAICVLCYIDVFMIAFKKDSLSYTDKLAKIKVVDYVRD